MINKKEKTLQEAALNVINRRANIDDIEYYVRSVMQPDRYHYMMGDSDFVSGFNYAKTSFIDIVQRSKNKKQGDEFVNNIMQQVEDTAEKTIGMNRHSNMMDNYWEKGYAYAYQEFIQFLQRDISYTKDK